jgi:hypothetical protein
MHYEWGIIVYWINLLNVERICIRANIFALQKIQEIYYEGGLPNRI